LVAEGVAMSDGQIVIELGELYTGENGSVAEAIIRAAADFLLNRIGSETIRHRIEQIRDDEIREHVRPLIATALTEPMQLTDEYGSPKGSAKPLSQIIVEKGMAQLQVKSYGNNKTPLEKFLSEEIERVFRNELREAMKEARGSVLAAVRQEGARIVEETITKMARS
jgi:hypothetical protein